MNQPEQLYRWSLEMSDYPMKETSSQDRRTTMAANATALRRDVTALLKASGILDGQRIDRFEGSPAGLQSIITTREYAAEVQRFIAAHIDANVQLKEDYRVDNAQKRPMPVPIRASA